MKKVLLVLSVAGMFAFSSCSKCQTCSYQGSDEQEYCEEDFPGGKKAYNNFIDAYEAQGWDCKK